MRKHKLVTSLEIIFNILIKNKKFTGYVDRNKKPLFVGDKYNIFTINGVYMKSGIVNDLQPHPTVSEYFDYFLPKASLIEKVI